jgi:hypothetical protein
VVEDVGEVATVTLVCGSSPGTVGLGRSTCAGGGAHRRRGIRPAHGEIAQSSESRGFTVGQGSRRRKELKNGSHGSSVYVRWRATEVQRQWQGLDPCLEKLHDSTGTLSRGSGEARGSRNGWSRWPALGWLGRAAQSSSELRTGSGQWRHAWSGVLRVRGGL